MTRIKHYTKNPYTDFYIAAAEKLHLNYTLPFENINLVIISHKDKELMVRNATLNINGVISYNLTKNKYISYKFFNINKIPHPHALLLKQASNLHNIEKNINDLKRPWVIKPTQGYGGKGVLVGINSFLEIKRYLSLNENLNIDHILESYVSGDNYRILLYDYKIIDIVKRIPAYVIGDGHSPLIKLIEKKNLDRKKIGLKEIKIDYEMKQFLELQNMDIKKFIPERLRQISLRRNCNMATGGETKRIEIQSVHPDNLKMFVEAAKCVNLNFAGIDFISANITESYKKNGAVINEINRDSSLDVHYYADMKLDNFIAEKILKLYFSI